MLLIGWRALGNEKTVNPASSHARPAGGTGRLRGLPAHGWTGVQLGRVRNEAGTLPLASMRMAPIPVRGLLPVDERRQAAVLSVLVAEVLAVRLSFASVPHVIVLVRAIVDADRDCAPNPRVVLRPTPKAIPHGTFKADLRVLAHAGDEQHQRSHRGVCRRADRAEGDANDDEDQDRDQGREGPDRDRVSGATYFTIQPGSAYVETPLQVAAVGDTHVENFGAWRDEEGRLVWA